MALPPSRFRVINQTLSRSRRSAHCGSVHGLRSANYGLGRLAGWAACAIRSRLRVFEGRSDAEDVDLAHYSRRLRRRDC
jgi:hypothetical protein